jgi:hypothetical protein
MDTIAAVTKTDTLYPAYINASRDPETGMVRVIVRGPSVDGASGKEASIEMTAAEWQDWIWQASPHSKRK